MSYVGIFLHILLIFFVLSDVLSNLILANVDMSLNAQREVDPLVYIEENCKGEKQCRDSINYGWLA